jgi:GTP-binding protein EngB required for normal cell division
MGEAANGSALEETAQGMVQQVHQALGDLTALEVHRERLGDATVDHVLETVADLRSRLGRSDVYVCVVGEQKAGKSTLLNAILGMELLGAAVRECTGTVSYLRRGSRLGYRARLESRDWEDFEAVFPDEEQAFSAAVAEQQAKLQECDAAAETHPAEAERLEHSLQDMNESLEVRTRKADTAEAHAADQQDDYEGEHKATDQFGAEIRAVEGDAPWPYRRAGGWRSIVHRTGRLALKHWEKPRWQEHLALVAQWEERRRHVAELAGRAKSAAELAASARRQAVEQQQTIEETTQRLAALRQAIADLPATRAGWQARWESTQDEWRRHREERLARFVQEVKQLTDMNRRGHDVEELHLVVPTDRLPEGVVLIDTPGVNTATEENRERAWRALQTQADACILVSDIAQTLSESTREFVRQIRDVTPHILLVLTKLDAALSGADCSGGDAEQEVAEAVQVGRTRFAEEVGRSEQEILAFAVAARPALKQSEGPAAEAFREELTRIFAVVEAERSIAVAARCARAIRNAHRATAEKIENAEQEYRHRIESLIEQQLRDPRAWCDEGIVALIPQIRRLGREVSQVLRNELQSQMAAFRGRIKEQIGAAANGQQLAEAVNQFQEGVPRELDQIAYHCRARIDAQFAHAIAQLIGEARQPLRERYRISQAVATAAPPPPPVTVQAISPAAQLSLSAAGAEVQAKVKKYVSRNKDLAYQMGRIGARAATARSSAGLAAAAVGIAASVAMGAMHARKFDGLKSQCIATIDELIEQLTLEATSEAALGPAAMERQLGIQLTAVVYHDAAAFQSWIQSVIHHEQQTLGQEQRKLGHLEAIRAKLGERDRVLKDLLQQATSLCRGLSRSRE